MLEEGVPMHCEGSTVVASASLALSETVLNLLPIGLSLVDARGELMFINDAGLRLFDVSSLDSLRTKLALGHYTLFETERAHTNTRIDLRRLFPEGGEDATFECSLVAKQKERVLRVTTKAYDTHLTLVTYEDVSEATRERLLSLSREGLSIDAESHSSSELLTQFLDKIEALTGSTLAFLQVLDEDEVTVLSRLLSHAAHALVDGQWDIHDGPEPSSLASTNASIRTPPYVIANDASLRPSPSHLATRHLTCTRTLSVPILRAGRLVALLELNNKLNNYTDFDGALASSLANWAWDLAEKKSAEELASDSRAILNGSLNAIVVTDRNLRITYLNPAFLKLFQRANVHDQIGQSVLEYWQDPTLAERVFREMAEDGFSAGELYGIRDDGSSFLVEFTGSSLRDRTGRLQGLFTTFIDVTDYHRVQTGLRDAEEKFAGAFHVISDSVHITDYSTDEIIEVNEGFERGSGYSRRELLGKTTIQLNLWYEPSERQTYYASLAKQGFVRGFQARLRTKSGRMLWVEHSSDFLQLSGRRCLVTITRDVTAQRAAAAALAESEQRFRNMFDLHDAAMLLIDPDTGTIRSANAAANRYFGVDFRTLIDRRIDEICTISEPESKTLLRAAGAGTTKAFGLQHRSGDGSLRESEVYASPIHYLGHTVLYAILHDVTERRKLEEQVRRVQRMDCLGNLASGVAHDINNVLSAILAHATVQREDSPHGSLLSDDLSTIIQACIRGRTLVRSLLDFARPQLSEQRILSLNGLVEEEVRLLSRTTLSQIALKLDLAEDLATISGDSSALGHALMNLCINAVDAMPRGGTLTIRTRNLSNTKVQLSVADTGHGMPPEILEKALDPFFSTKPHGKGTGLGLPMVYSAAEAHAAQFEIVSNEGQGTIVTLTFPTVDAPIENAPESQVGRFFVDTLSILVVDDDWIVLRGLTRQLTRLGHRVMPCNNGLEALRLLEDSSLFDLVVIDVNMPDVGGCDVFLRGRELGHTCPFLFVTGRPDEALQQFVAEHPRTNLLAKPFTQSELKNSLRQVYLGPNKTASEGPPRRTARSFEGSINALENEKPEFEAEG